MKSTPHVNHTVSTTRRKSSNRFSNADIGQAVDFFISQHPDAPWPDVAHSVVQWNVILLKNSVGTIAVAMPDGSFLASIGGPEYDGGQQ